MNTPDRSGVRNNSVVDAGQDVSRKESSVREEAALREHGPPNARNEEGGVRDRPVKVL